MGPLQPACSESVMRDCSPGFRLVWHRAALRATRWLHPGYRRAGSIRAGQPADGEFDAIPGQHAPSLDLGLIGGLGEAPEQLARLGARLLARQREALAPERVRARARAVGDERG